MRACALGSSDSRIHVCRLEINLIDVQLPSCTGPTWPAGSVQEVAFTIFVNHGGGYSYRLCPSGSNLTESCFQKTHLRFVGDTQWIQYGDDKSNRSVCICDTHLVTTCISTLIRGRTALKVVVQMGLL